LSPDSIARKTMKYFISVRMSIFNFLSNFEFYIFHAVINKKSDKFLNKIQTFNSIDHFISYHSKFIKEIYHYLCIKDEMFNKILFKLFNMIFNYPFMLNKFILIINDQPDKLEDAYMEIFNYMAKFKRNEEKLYKYLDKYKEKLH
jgi:hypothetical protein